MHLSQRNDACFSKQRNLLHYNDPTNAVTLSVHMDELSTVTIDGLSAAILFITMRTSIEYRRQLDLSVKEISMVATGQNVSVKEVGFRCK